MGNAAHTDELRPGVFVTKAVRLLRPLAQGGMGKVWVAEHLSLGTQVVVKFMSPEIALLPGALERFTREAAALAAVKSPHVVQVFDAGLTESGVPYIVMELLDGEDLAHHLAHGGPMPVADVVRVVVQVGKALAKAHRIGVVHRDIKPENIFLCRDDAEPGEPLVKLLDFGTAKLAETSTSLHTTGTLTGTPYYMSPEQILGLPTDPRTDLWSLGVVVFEALSGVRPFDGGSLGAITLAIHSPPPSLMVVAPHLSPTLDAWFQRACAKELEARFATARGAIDAFVEAATGPVGRTTISSIPASGFSIDAPPLRIEPTPAARISLEPARAPSLAQLPARAPIASTLDERPSRRRHLVSWVAGGVMCLAMGVMAGLVSQSRPWAVVGPAAPPPPRAAITAPPREPAPSAPPTSVASAAEPPVDPDVPPAAPSSAEATAPSSTMDAGDPSRRGARSAGRRRGGHPVPVETAPVEIAPEVEDPPPALPTFEPRKEPVDPWSTPHGTAEDGREVRGFDFVAPSGS